MARTTTLIGEEQGGLTRRTLLGAGTAALGSALLARPASALAATSPSRSGVPTPEGFRKFLVYIAEGKAGGITDPEFVLAFQREVYGRDEAAVVAYSMDAKEFFLERFGLDFRGASAPTATGPWEIEGARLQGSVFSPANHYTAYVVSEEWVGAAGWIVRDSSFNVTLTEDQTLHGRWGGAAGKPAKAGAAMTFGDYSIKVDRPGASERGETIQIHFESGSPIVADVDGTRHFVCDLAHPVWGPGHARGVVLADGAVRNVLTFPPGLP
jgi:hypothetical protein